MTGQRTTGVGPQLSSVATALAELTDRVTELAETLTAADREDLATELFEAERALLTGRRRLEKVVDQMG